MKKQSKKFTFWTGKNSAIVVIVVALLAGGTLFAVQKVRAYNDAADQANMVNIRELILLAVKGLKKDAPVDPRTGDVYFPESKLYLPNPSTPLTLTYLFDKGNVTDSQSELSVSTYPVRHTEALYEAKNVTELFDEVPKLQACSRGVKLVYNKFPSSDSQNILKHSVRLSNGKELYIYLEKDCPELNPTADLFTNIRAY